MTTNPFINALAALAYIAAVVSFIFYGIEEGPDPEGIIMPITMLSLLVLSVLAMAYCFFFQPVQLYLDGKKREAAALFVQSVGLFACITFALLLTLFVFA